MADWVTNEEGFKGVSIGSEGFGSPKKESQPNLNNDNKNPLTNELGAFCSFLCGCSQLFFIG
jgi:hypothetical protein